MGSKGEDRCWDCANPQRLIQCFQDPAAHYWQNWRSKVLSLQQFVRSRSEIWHLPAVSWPEALHNHDNLGHNVTWRKSRWIGFPLIDTIGFDDPENETDVQTMFMARYGPVDGSQRRNILSMKAWICNLHIRTVRIGSTGREQHGWHLSWNRIMGITQDFDATKKGKQGYRIRSAHFYFVLTKNVAELSTFNHR